MSAEGARPGHEAGGAGSGAYGLRGSVGIGGMGSVMDLSASSRPLPTVTRRTRRRVAGTDGFGGMSTVPAVRWISRLPDPCAEPGRAAWSRHFPGPVDGRRVCGAPLQYGRSFSICQTSLACCFGSYRPDRTRVGVRPDSREAASAGSARGVRDRAATLHDRAERSPGGRVPAPRAARLRTHRIRGGSVHGPTVALPSGPNRLLERRWRPRGEGRCPGRPAATAGQWPAGAAGTPAAPASPPAGCPGLRGPSGTVPPPARGVSGKRVTDLLSCPGEQPNFRPGARR